jgi:hypothetical protein
LKFNTKFYNFNKNFVCVAAAASGLLYGAIGEACASLDHPPIEQSGSPSTMERDMNDFETRRREEQAKFDRCAPKQIQEVALQSLNRAADRMEKAAHPIEQKRRLANTIRARVRCPHMAQVEAERAAEYVIFDGLPLEVMMQLLDELDEAERAGKVRPYIDGRGGGRGGWFVGVLKLRLHSYGIAQRRKKEKP